MISSAGFKISWLSFSNENFIFFEIDIIVDKIGSNFRNWSACKLEISKNVFIKSCCFKKLFFNDLFFQEFIFQRLWKSKFVKFEVPVVMSIQQKTEKSFRYVLFWKSLS